MIPYKPMNNKRAGPPPPPSKTVNKKVPVRLSTQQIMEKQQQLQGQIVQKTNIDIPQANMIPSAISTNQKSEQPLKQTQGKIYNEIPNNQTEIKQTKDIKQQIKVQKQENLQNPKQQNNRNKPISSAMPKVPVKTPINALNRKPFPMKAPPAQKVKIPHEDKSSMLNNQNQSQILENKNYISENSNLNQISASSQNIIHQQSQQVKNQKQFVTQTIFEDTGNYKHSDDNFQKTPKKYKQNSLEMKNQIIVKTKLVPKFSDLKKKLENFNLTKERLLESSDSQLSESNTERQSHTYSELNNKQKQKLKPKLVEQRKSNKNISKLDKRILQTAQSQDVRSHAFDFKDQEVEKQKNNVIPSALNNFMQQNSIVAQGQALLNKNEEKEVYNSIKPNTSQQNISEPGRKNENLSKTSKQKFQNIQITQHKYISNQNSDFQIHNNQHLNQEDQNLNQKQIIKQKTIQNDQHIDQYQANQQLKQFENKKCNQVKDISSKQLVKLIKGHKDHAKLMQEKNQIVMMSDNIQNIAKLIADFRNKKQQYLNNAQELTHLCSINREEESKKVKQLNFLITKLDESNVRLKAVVSQQ